MDSQTLEVILAIIAIDLPICFFAVWNIRTSKELIDAIEDLRVPLEDPVPEEA